MSAHESSPLGPTPFRFTPHGGTIEGNAFSPPFKALTATIVLGSAWWWMDLWLAGKFGATGLDGLRAGGWFVLGWLLLAWTGWEVAHSRIRLDSTGLEQSWMWQKRMDYDDLAYAKLIRVRGLEWLIAPRLYVRTLAGKFAVFYITDPQVLSEGARLCGELQAFREM